MKSSVPDIKISSLPPDKTTSVILAFLERWFPVFREEYVKTMSLHREDEISQSLHLFLQDKAKMNNFLFAFNGQKGVDYLISIQPLILSAKPIFVIEAKRLPPTNNKDYVQGRTGGIERFKREQEGFSFDRNQCAMVAYVQRNDFAHWFEKINSWIIEMCSNNQEFDGAGWEESDKLVKLSSEKEHMVAFISNHSRKTLTRLTIHHFWLDMRSNSLTE